MDDKKIDVRGERYVCRLSKKHRFSNLKTITNELFSTHLQGNLSKCTVKRILKKYGIRNYARKRKPFVSFQSRKARVRSASAVQDWQVAEWKDVVSPTSAGLDLKMTVKHYDFGVQNKRSMILPFSSRRSKMPPL